MFANFLVDSVASAAINGEFEVEASVVCELDVLNSEIIRESKLKQQRHYIITLLLKKIQTWVLSLVSLWRMKLNVVLPSSILPVALIKSWLSSNLGAI